MSLAVSTLSGADQIRQVHIAGTHTERRLQSAVRFPPARLPLAGEARPACSPPPARNAQKDACIATTYIATTLNNRTFP